MADSKQYTEDGMEILFWDLPSHRRPNFNRPARKSKRWTSVEKFRWVVAPQGEHYPYMISYFVEEFIEVSLPADRPQVTWDL